MQTRRFVQLRVEATTSVLKEPLCSYRYMAVRLLFASGLISHKEQTNDRKDDHENLIIRHAITSASAQHAAEAPVTPSCLHLHDRNGNDTSITL